MKITHRKQKGERYALVFETRHEAVQFVHYVGCRNSSQNCKLNEIKDGEFHKILDNLIFHGETKLPVW